MKNSSKCFAKVQTLTLTHTQTHDSLYSMYVELNSFALCTHNQMFCYKRRLFELSKYNKLKTKMKRPTEVCCWIKKCRKLNKNQIKRKKKNFKLKFCIDFENVLTTDRWAKSKAQYQKTMKRLLVERMDKMKPSVLERNSCWIRCVRCALHFIFCSFALELKHGLENHFIL